MNYNVRQQMFAVRVGTDGNAAADADPLGTSASYPGAWDRGLLVNSYGNGDLNYWGTSGTDNNGNVLRTHQYVPCAGGGACSLTYQDESYDALNRLTQTTEYDGGSTQMYAQAYDYDRWGNRTINQTTTTSNVNKKLYTVDTATNRLGVPSGQSGAMQYDAVGNVISDTYTSAGGQRIYDGENRMTKAVGTNGQWEYYYYDAEGKRVRRVVNGQETWLVYGFEGELVAEYNRVVALV